MKKLIRLGVFLSLATLCSTVFASYDAIFKEDCNLRDKPKSIFTKGDKQIKGNTCTVLEEQEGWCKIVAGDKIGWVTKSELTAKEVATTQDSGSDNQSYKSKLSGLLNNGGKGDSYTEALSHRKNGEYAEALALFEKLGNYKDAKQLYVKTFKEMIQSLKPGQSFKFGNFYNNDLEWDIVEKNNESALVLCRYSFKDKYDGKGDNFGWAGASLKKTLNTTFYNDAFSEIQKSCIVEAQTDQAWESKKENSDMVFCLGKRDIEKYSFILINSILKNGDEFWLRTTMNDGLQQSGRDKGMAFCYQNGNVRLRSQTSILPVRPAMRVTLK